MIFVPFDLVSFFSRFGRDRFLVILSVIALALLICLAAAVTGFNKDYSPDAIQPAGEGNASAITSENVTGAIGYGPVDEYYRDSGAVREQLTLDDIWALALANGGFTYNPLYGATPQRGYAVALQGHEKIYDSGTVTIDDLREYLRENGEQMKDPARYFGGWINDGKLYLDVSIVLPTEEEARKIGRMNDQTDVYDFVAGENIFLKGPDGQWLVDASGGWLAGTADAYGQSAAAALTA